MTNKFRIYPTLLAIHVALLLWLDRILRLWKYDIPWSRTEFVTFIKDYVETFNKTIKCNGLILTIKKYKTARNHLTRYICDQPLFINDVRIGLTNDGLPKVLGILIPSIRLKNLTSLRLGLTILSLGRLFPGNGADYDLNSITASTTEEPKLILSITEYASKSRICSNFILQDWSRPHFSNKSGPNGHALGHSLIDFISMTPNLYNNLITLGGDNLKDYLLSIYKIVNYFPIIGRNLRKIFIVKDKELKNRPIAIFDYWSQTCLWNLNEALFERLKLIPQDMTYDQSNIGDLIQMNEHSYHSLDLASATDRFPISLQTKILEILIGKSKSLAWKAIMTQPLKGPKGETVRYATGQPMGARSSWAMFALSHHIVVQFAAYNVGYKSFTDYRLLGDDIVIHNDIVAAEYIKVMTGLGVEISKLKTHTSKYAFELAKRWFYKGTEITPFPIGAIASDVTPLGIANALQTAFNKGWSCLNASSYSYETSLTVLYKYLSYSNAFARKQVRLTRMLSLAFNYLHLYSHKEIDRIGVDSVLRELAAIWTGHHSCNATMRKFELSIREEVKRLTSDLFFTVARRVEDIKVANEFIVGEIERNFHGRPSVKGGPPNFRDLPTNLVLEYQLDDIRERMYKGSDYSEHCITDSLGDMSRLALCDPATFNKRGQRSIMIQATHTLFMKIDYIFKKSDAGEIPELIK